MGRKVLVGLVLVIALLFLRMALKQLGTIASSLQTTSPSPTTEEKRSERGEGEYKPKSEIVRMANERPDQLASLVRNWLTRE